jgi:ABC-2 type transport system ATP-binding protein
MINRSDNLLTGGIMSEYFVEVENVNHYYGPKHILKDIDLKVVAGEIYGLLGPSGCGKTTLVKIMAGILECATGTAQILGQTMPNLQLMAKVGYMAQSDALYMQLTAEENLDFFGRVYGMKKGTLKERIREVMDLVNLAEDLKKPVQAYSGGMKRRLSLALALLHQPPVLLLDEPTVGIDPLLRKDIWDELHRLAAQGTAILVTTHVMDEAEKCHQLAMMRDGVLLAKGPLQEIMAKVNATGIEDAFIRYGGGLHES